MPYLRMRPFLLPQVLQAREPGAVRTGCVFVGRFVMVFLFFACVYAFEKTLKADVRCK